MSETKEAILRRCVSEGLELYKRAVALLDQADGGYQADSEVPGNLLHAACRALEHVRNSAEQLPDAAT